MQTARVAGFLPSTSGFRFANSFPPGIPVITITIPPLGTISLGDASNGVCGGMVYAVMDFFFAQPRLLPPTTSTAPAGGSALMNYILSRLLDGFFLQGGPLSNAMRYVDFMSTLDHDTWLSRGIPSIIVGSEWPKIKADIDAGRPSPVGLVGGTWVWPTNIAAKITMLGHCHCVLAYAYDLDDASNLTLFVYDPNDPLTDDSTISMNIGRPTHTTPISTPKITNMIAGHVTFRAFFKHEFYFPVTPPAGISPGPIPPVLPTGSAGCEVAFQANTTNLWSVGADNHGDWRLGMMPGTSPSIAALPGGGYVVAFQANTGNLWTVGADNRGDWGLGMMAGTSPRIAALPGGGYEVAFQANTGNLWTVGADNHGDWGLGMMAGTSPSIAALPGGGYVVAFQANTGNLWTVGADNHGDWGLGMMAGTSPSIAALPGGGYEVAFQANTTSLWTVGADNHGDWQLGMMPGTSPSIAALEGGGYEVAFQANTGNLWTVGADNHGDWGLGMMTGTSPSIAQ
jgi:hypothetical protein